MNHFFNLCAYRFFHFAHKEGEMIGGDELEDNISWGKLLRDSDLVTCIQRPIPFWQLEKLQMRVLFEKALIDLEP